MAIVLFEYSIWNVASVPVLVCITGYTPCTLGVTCNCVLACTSSTFALSEGIVLHLVKFYSELLKRISSIFRELRTIWWSTPLFVFCSCSWNGFQATAQNSFACSLNWCDRQKREKRWKTVFDLEYGKLISFNALLIISLSFSTVTNLVNVTAGFV